MDPNRPGIREDIDGLWDWNLASGRVHFSPRWIALLGCEDHEIGNSPDEWLTRVHPEDLRQLRDELDAMLDGSADEFTAAHRLRHKDGTYRWMSCQGAAVRNENGDLVRLRGSHSDVTAATVTDPLTGLPNHLLLNDRLGQSIDRARRYPGFRFALLLIELGRRPGAATSGIAGDPLLTTTARRLETCLRIGDTTATLRNNDLVARMSGDRFAVLLDGLKDVSHAKTVAERLLSEIVAPLNLNGRDVFLTASIGIAVSASGYQQARDVTRDAEIAAHRARTLGGSHCEIFDTGALKSEQAELLLEADLAAALERREFELFYQPIISVASNTLVGFEALVRWNHPVLGLVAPQDFIPLTEKTGFIVSLGEWILTEACLRLKEWQQHLPAAGELWMSVNLSAVQLKHPELNAHVERALQESGITPHNLVLELTEGSAMENPTAVKTLLMQLRAAGVRISIDDFGTGYSSLAYLRQFPVDTLKVDRSFVRGMETHKASADIVGNLTAMAQQLGVHVVAEGIENEQQLALLRTLQCQSAQGYLFAKPLDAAGATAFIQTGVAPQGRRTRPGKNAAATTRAAARFALPWHLATRNRVPATVAAALVLMYAGFAGHITPIALQLPDNPPSPTRQLAATATPIAAPRGGIPARVATAAALPATTRIGAANGATTGAGPGPVVMSPHSYSAGPATPPAALAGTPQRMRQVQESIEVAHQHRIGSCKGRLLVSSTGVAFEPDDKASKDAFAFAFNDFLQTVEGDTLTIKTASRTYRFKTSVGEGGLDPAALRRITDSIASFR